MATLLPTDRLTEWGLFSDEGCVERGLYGADDVRAALERSDPDDDLRPGPMCDCGAERCECEAGYYCECEGED